MSMYTVSGDGWSGWGVIGNVSNWLSSTRNKEIMDLQLIVGDTLTLPTVCFVL